MAVSGSAVAKYALRFLGTPYVWGGNQLRQGIDCSGLVQQVFKEFGIGVPRVTYDQINVGASVPVNKLREGDLVFFDTDRTKRGPDHVGIYIGGGKFVHAPRPGSSVKVSSLGESYYMNRWMGGRRMGGVTSGGTGGAFGVAGLELEPEPVKLEANELAEKYGMSLAFFKSQKELKNLLDDAVEGQWTPERFQASVRNSKWWKTHSSSVRKAQVLAKSDPATYRATLEGARASAEKAAMEMGAILSKGNVEKLAKNMVTLEWNEAQVANFLGQYVKFQEEGTLGGVAGQAADRIRQTAYEMGISTTDQSVLNNAQYIVRGLTTLEKVEGQLREQAASMYPAFEEQLKAGASVTDLAQPYVQMMAGEWGIPDTDIDAFHPTIKRAINRVGQSGEPEPMPLSDFQKMIREDSRWRKTPVAANQTMGVARQVLEDMGLR